MKILNQFKRLRTWIFLGLIMDVLYRFNFAQTNDHSALNFIELLLFALFIIGIRLNKNNTFYKRFSFLQGSRKAYIFLSWLFGMLFELTLSTSPGNIGGMHPNTAISFLVAQGFYIPFAILGLYLIRKYHYTFKELYFASIAAAMAEGIVFNHVIPALLFTPLFFLIPIVIAYYGLVYSLFLCLPLIFINPQSLYSENFKEISLKRKIIYGFAIAVISLLIYAIWYVIVTNIIKV